VAYVGALNGIVFLAERADARVTLPAEVIFNEDAQTASPAMEQDARRALALYTMVSAPPEGWNAFAKAELARNGLEDSSDVLDPETGKVIKGVGDGHMYIHAYHHLARKKLCLREDAEYETIDGWRKGADITSKDLIHTLDLQTGEDRWRHPVNVREYRKDSEPLFLYQSEDGAQELVVTRDHRLCVNGELFQLFEPEEEALNAH
jgi:hypothetical protein